MDNTENKENKGTIVYMKQLFNNLDYIDQVELADWCHEQVMSNSGEMVKEKFEKVGKQLNSFVARSKDFVMDSSEKIAKKAINTFNEIVDTGEDTPSPNSAKGRNIF